MHIELPPLFFYTLLITNILVMGTGSFALYEMIWSRWNLLKGEKLVHVIVLVGMLTSFFVAILLLIKSISIGGGVVRLFG